MNRSTSIAIDLLRFFAALAVYLTHALPIFAPAVPEIPGHHAVVVFFVLSGFVIAHVTLRPQSTATGYAIDRASRLLSVSLPALLCSFAFYVLLRQALQSHPAGHLLGNIQLPFDTAGAYTLLNAVFMAQSGERPVLAPLNGPFWSLNYEFWYYVIFGAWCFVRPVPARLLIVLLLVWVAGLRIFLLLPCWLIGVAVYRIAFRPSAVLPRPNWLLPASALAYLVFLFSGISYRCTDWLDAAAPGFMSGLGPSRDFLTDYLLAAIFATTLLAFCKDMAQLRHAALAKVAAWLGGLTFSLYAFHIPLLAAALAAMNYLGDTPWTHAAALILIPVAVVPISHLTDTIRRSSRRMLGRWFEQPHAAG